MTEAQIPLSYTTVHYCWIMSSAEALSKAIYIEFTGQTGSRFDFLKGGAGPVLVWCGQNGFVFAFFFQTAIHSSGETPHYSRDWRKKSTAR
jgi:hypothetical protein